MKATKMSLVVGLTLALSLGLAAASWARPWGGGWGGGPGAMMNLTPEQAGKLFDLRQKFMNDTAEVRKKVMIQRIELANLWKAEKPDEKAIIAKQKELNALRSQLQEKSVAFRLAARKIAPQLGQGFHHRGWGMYGPGAGIGPGAGMGPVGGLCVVGGPCPGPGGGPGPAAPPKE
jgi:zinc resistance-associated protein